MDGRPRRHLAVARRPYGCNNERGRRGVDFWARRTLVTEGGRHQTRPAHAHRTPRIAARRFRRLTRGEDCEPEALHFAKRAYVAPRLGSLLRRPGHEDALLDLTEGAGTGGRKRGPVVVTDELEDMELRGEEWRREAASLGRGVKKRRL